METLSLWAAVGRGAGAPIREGKERPIWCVERICPASQLHAEPSLGQTSEAGFQSFLVPLQGSLLGTIL